MKKQAKHPLTSVKTLSLDIQHLQNANISYMTLIRPFMRNLWREEKKNRIRFMGRTLK